MNRKTQFVIGLVLIGLGLAITNPAHIIGTLVVSLATLAVLVFLGYICGIITFGGDEGE